jgi:hypothetical protein
VVAQEGDGGFTLDENLWVTAVESGLPAHKTGVDIGWRLVGLSKKEIPLHRWKWDDVRNVRDKQPRPWLFTFQGTELARAGSAREGLASAIQPSSQKQLGKPPAATGLCTAPFPPPSLYIEIVTMESRDSTETNDEITGCG